MLSLKCSALILLALCLASCAGIGPLTVSRDRFDYTGAMGRKSLG
jgi:hypothetical protein